MMTCDERKETNRCEPRYEKVPSHRGAAQDNGPPALARARCASSFRACPGQGRHALLTQPMVALTILADLDGTLLPRPYGTGKSASHPNLSLGPAYDPLCRLLSLGCTVVGITGSRLATHQERFFDELPVEHRRAGRVMLAVQTGLHLYRASAEDGSPVEDAAFEATIRSKITPSFAADVISTLVEAGRIGIRRFYADLARTPELVDSGGPLAYLLECDAEEVPVTQDNRRCPRIEVRDGNSAVVFVGVPSGLNANYFAVPEALKALVDGRPTGRACFDCVPHGLDKSLVVAHLLETGVAVAGRTVAFGDQPGGNDDGLTRWHRHPEQDVPFISVSEHRSMVPEHLRECHHTLTTLHDSLQRYGALVLPH